jgi:hypothetical protein
VRDVIFEAVGEAEDGVHRRPSLDLDQLQELPWAFAAQRVVTVAGRVGLLGLLAAGSAIAEEAP